MALDRAHLYLPLIDQTGALYRYAQVRIYQQDGVTPFTGPLYRDPTSAKTFGNPYALSPALVDLYLDGAARVVVGVVTDTTKPEVLTNPIDVVYDGAEAVSTLFPLTVVGTPTGQALLCGQDPATAYWKPLRIDHEHAGVAPGTVRTGVTSKLLAQSQTYPSTTVIGSGAGGNQARGSLAQASMLGRNADSYGFGASALGYAAFAAEGPVTPFVSSGVALGALSAASYDSVALGARSGAALSGQIAIGRGTATTDGAAVSAVAIGPGAAAGLNGVALGAGTGLSAHGSPGSIGVGAGAQYGLPSDADPTHYAVMLGARDPSVNPIFPWTNPLGSQSESPLDEFAPTMQFASRTVQFQRHLQWVINSVALQVGGDAVLGSRTGTLGFHGATPRARQVLGDDEPTSGIPALDSLIYALRDLGLLQTRNEALVTYRARDLMVRYRNGDQVPVWPEHFGTDLATSAGQANPSYVGAHGDFNGYPAVLFDNGVYRRSSKPVQELRGAKLLPYAKHFAVAAEHTGAQFGAYEGLFNLSGGETVPGDDTVFIGDVPGSTTWVLNAITKYEVDGLDQTRNRTAGLPAPHVYRVTNVGTWPHARPIIGGPRDQISARPWDNFSGAVAEVVGMDDTWDEAHVHSMSTGLAFKYGINQNPGSLQQPAENLLLTQHNPAHGTYVFWNRDYSDNYIGKVYGRGVNVPKPVIFVPFCSIFIWFDVFSFRGSLLGNWGNLIGFSFDYEIEISVTIDDFSDQEGDFDARVDVDIEFNEDIEISVGSFSLNNNLTWSMGQFGCHPGHKICRIRHRQTRQVMCINGAPPFRYYDTEVRVYSTKSDGTLLLEGTSPLWGDGTFGVRVRHPGHKVARIYEVSTGNLLGTTEYQEKALPRTTVYASDDPDYSFANTDTSSTYSAALTAMAFCDVEPANQYRARHIIKTLAGVVNADGTLNDSYSSSLPAVTARGTGQIASVWGAAWTILAVLRYQQATGDGQFLPFAQRLATYLAGTVLPSGSIPTAPGQTTAKTSHNVVLYFALRDLAAATGSSAYATAAQNVRASLLANHWSSSLNRFGPGLGDTSEAVEADLWGGLFLLAIGDRTKARATLRHLRRFRVKGAQISAPHYSGAAGLTGYKPFAELGTPANVNPPAVIDQMHSWLATLFKGRYGEPIGDDVASLLRWQFTAISSDPGHQLYGQQFLSYSGNATSAPYSLRARPGLVTAAWAFLISKGALGVLTPDPLPTPAPTGLAVVPRFDAGSYRVVFGYSWTVDPAIPVAAYEAVPEFSVDAGQTWFPATSSTISGSVENLRDSSVGTNGFSSTWSVPVPDNRATLYRVRVRLRNAVFGTWVASGSVSLPAIS